jgi:pilus assembly protein CpaE
LEQHRLRVLLIEENSSYAGEVQGWLASHGRDVTFVLNWVDSVEAAVKRLGEGGLDAILLDLPMGKADPLETVAIIRRHAPSTPILVLSAKENMKTVEEVVGRGADECLIKNVIAEDEYKARFLARTIGRLVAEYEERAEGDRRGHKPDRARVIGVIGAGGGVGTTTLACTLAAEVSEQTKQRTLLADLDLNAGMVAFLMGIAPEYSLSDAVSNLDRLDVSVWEKLATKGPAGVDIISSPGFLGEGELKADSLFRLAEVLEPVYQWVVIDLGRMNTTALTLLAEVDELLVVTSVGMCVLQQSKRLLAALAKGHSEKTKVHLVVNHLLHHSALSEEELSGAFGVPIYASLPTDEEAVNKAVIERTLIAAGSDFRKQVAKMARRLAGLPEPKPDGPFASFRRHFAFDHKAHESDPVAETVPVPESVPVPQAK